MIGGEYYSKYSPLDIGGSLLLYRGFDPRPIWGTFDKIVREF